MIARPAQDRSPRRAGPARLRPRRQARPPPLLGRPGRRAPRALPRRLRRLPIQPRTQGLPSAPPRERQAHQDRPHRHRQETPHAPQRHHPRRTNLRTAQRPKDSCYGSCARRRTPRSPTTLSETDGLRHGHCQAAAPPRAHPPLRLRQSVRLRGLPADPDRIGRPAVHEPRRGLPGQRFHGELLPLHSGFPAQATLAFIVIRKRSSQRLRFRLRTPVKRESNATHRQSREQFRLILVENRESVSRTTKEHSLIVEISMGCARATHVAAPPRRHAARNECETPLAVRTNED